jgi:hypothetical protein
VSDWRKEYRESWTNCQCGISWRYQGKRLYHGKEQKTWARHWVTVSNVITVWSDEEMQFNDADCWHYLKLQAIQKIVGPILRPNFTGILEHPKTN